MRRKLHIVETWSRTEAPIRIADETGKVVCTLPWDELRMAKFICASVNTMGFGLRPYDRDDWLRGKNTLRGKNAKATVT